MKPKPVVFIATAPIGTVKIAVTDLDGFVHAKPDENVFVETMDGQQTWVLKGELKNLLVDPEP